MPVAAEVPVGAGGPLAGVRVVELGVWVAVASAAAILADWGADVVKVEPLTGDPFRQVARVGPDGPNPAFELDNRGKRAIAVDLGDDRGREVLDLLLGDADIFLTNMRPRTLAAWGLDPASLRQRHPSLVVGTLTGYGAHGEQRDRPSYDVGGFWARSGLADAHSVGGQPPSLRGAVGDHVSALSLAAGVCASLAARERTGRGHHVATSLLRNGLFALSQDANYLARLGAWFPSDRGSAANPLYNSYRTADDRWLWLLGLQPDRHWPIIAVTLGHPEWLGDPRFEDVDAQRANAAALIGLLEEAFATRPLEEWSAALDDAGIWWEPVRRLDEVLADEQLLANGGLVDVPAPCSGEPIRTIATPVDFDGRSRVSTGGAPELGGHTDEVLRAAGCTDEHIRQLRSDGVVG